MASGVHPTHLLDELRARRSGLKNSDGIGAIRVFFATTRTLPQHRETAIPPVLEKALKRLSEKDLESQLDVEGFARANTWRVVSRPNG